MAKSTGNPGGSTANNSISSNEGYNFFLEKPILYCCKELDVVVTEQMHRKRINTNI